VDSIGKEVSEPLGQNYVCVESTTGKISLKDGKDPNFIEFNEPLGQIYASALFFTV